MASSFVRRLGRHHFAHLRCVAEGVSVLESAQRYLGVEHGHQARCAHQEVVDWVRSIARRRGERAWRLVGLLIRLPLLPQRPSLDDFIEAHELHGWSETEVQQQYALAYPTDAKAEAPPPLAGPAAGAAACAGAQQCRGASTQRPARWLVG